MCSNCPTRMDVLARREGEYVLVSKKTGKVLRKFGKKKPTDEEVEVVEQQIESFERSRRDFAIKPETLLERNIKIQTTMAKASGKNFKIKKQPRNKTTRQMERAFQRKMRGILNRTLEVVKRNVVERLPAILEEAGRNRSDSSRNDGVVEDVQALFKSVTSEVENLAGESIVQQAAEEFALGVEDLNRNNLSKAFQSAIGLDLVGSEPFLGEQLQIFALGNANLIKNVQEEFVGEVQDVVFRGIQRGERASEISKKILGRVKDKDGFTGRFKKAVNRANLIARDQIGKLNADLNQQRQKSVGVKRYIWRTARDERVRGTKSEATRSGTDSHELEGALFEWGKTEGVFIEGPRKGQKAFKPRNGLNPGEDFQCRCWAEPYLEDILPDIAA